MSTEERLITDLPINAVQLLVDAVVSENEDESVLAQIGHYAGLNLVNSGTSVAGWIGANLSEGDARRALGKAAKKGGWFKTVTLGARLGETVGAALPAIAGSPTARLLRSLASWVYG